MSLELDVSTLHYSKVNRLLREAILEGETEFVLKGVNGHRYLAAGISAKVKIDIQGVPGLDLGAFMRGPVINVYGNSQDGAGNTMDDGKIVIHGMAGDVVGYAMRGGKIHIKEDVGYRVGIHMKAYMDKVPVLIIGGKAGDFLGEYMAGGVIVLLGMFSRYPERPIAGLFLGTGMHGGTIYIRGKVKESQLGLGLKPYPLESKDEKLLEELLNEYAQDFGLDPSEFFKEDFVKIIPYTHRPYGKLYAY
jgi:glutamate synthase domain-containing protein 3